MVPFLTFVRMRLTDGLLAVVAAFAAAEAALLLFTLGSSLLAVSATGLSSWGGAADVALPAVWTTALALISRGAWRRTTWGCRAELDDTGACRRHRGYCDRSRWQRSASG